MALIFKRTCLLNVIYRHLDLVKDLVFILAILLNVFVMMSYTIYDGNSMYSPKLFYYCDTYFTQLLFIVLGVVQTILCLMLLVYTMYKIAPVRIAEAQLKRQHNKRRMQQKVQLSLQNSSAQKQKQLGGLQREQPASEMKKESMSRQFWLAIITLTLMFKEAFIFYYLVLVLSAVLGTFVHPFIYIFMLFQILVRFSLLRGVINAVWRPKKQILLAFLLYYLIQYGYSLLGFFAFQASYQNQCDTVLNCWITTLDLAYKQDGGIGGWLLSEYNEPLGGRIYYWRFLFDTTFDLLINIIMINILAGIIIDTFAVLRDEHQRAKDELRNTCLVCGVSRSDLDKNSFFKGFEYHMRQEHNVYSYVFYISYLRSKDPTEYSGIESFVSERLDQGDISWFPLDFDRCQELKERDANQIQELEQDQDSNEVKLPLVNGNESGEEGESKSQEIEDLKGEVAQLKLAVQQLTKSLGERKEKK